MSDILLNNGDIMITKFGDIDTVVDYDEIVQSAVNNMLLIYGEYEAHDDIGNKTYNRRLKISDSSLDIIKYDCIDAISGDDRISNVISIDITRTDIPNTVNISFVLEIIDGTMVSNSIKISI